MQNLYEISENMRWKDINQHLNKLKNLSCSWMKECHTKSFMSVIMYQCNSNKNSSEDFWGIIDYDDLKFHVEEKNAL